MNNDNKFFNGNKDYKNNILFVSSLYKNGLFFRKKRYVYYDYNQLCVGVQLM